MRVLFGLILLSNAANFVIFAAGGMSEGLPPLIGRGDYVLEAPYSNPLPQALILTAIVISFGLLAFALQPRADLHLRNGFADGGDFEFDRHRRRGSFLDTQLVIPGAQTSMATASFAGLLRHGPIA